MNKKNTIGTLLIVGCGAVAIYGVKKYIDIKKKETIYDNEELFNIIPKEQKVLSQSKYKKYLSKEISTLVNTANNYQKLIDELIGDLRIGDINEELYNMRIKELSNLKNITPKKDIVCDKLSEEILIAEDFILNLVKNIDNIKKKIIKAYSEEDIESLVELNNLCVRVIQAELEGITIIDSIIIHKAKDSSTKENKKGSNYGIIKVKMENYNN